MKNGYLKAAGIPLAYQVYNATAATTIFFVHANSGSSAAWHKQVSSPLLNAYRLITIDLPNHGDSAELAPETEISLPALGKIMADAIQQLAGNKPYMICSISLGTNITAEMLSHDIHPAGLLMAGPCMVGKHHGLDKMMLKDADVSAVFEDSVPLEKVSQYAGITMHSKAEADTTNFLNDYDQVRGNFRSALFASIAAANYSDQIELLNNSGCPVCVVFGKQEMVIDTHYLDGALTHLWNHIIYTIDNASHLVNIDAPNAFNELLAAFAGAVLTTYSE